MGYLTPDVEPRSDTAESSLYLRSYLAMRAVVGVAGIALPVVLLVGDLLLNGSAAPRGSLSAYYHSGMRDIFVGTLCVTAIFLVTYKVFEHNLDNTLSLLAGLGALGVAMFPAGRPGASGPLTPLQERLGETATAVVHYGCAAVLICSLAAISFFFGVREGKRPRRAERRSPLFWRNFHWGCALVMMLAVAFILVTRVVPAGDHSLLIGEVVALLAFGASWLMKGLELDVLLNPEPAARPVVAPA